MAASSASGHSKVGRITGPKARTQTNQMPAWLVLIGVTIGIVERS
jgi:riboflavin biosynthesis pyrimidine reductase